jgi:phosphatidylglycerol:prolipoprotein diacylglycerol transferase
MSFPYLSDVIKALTGYDLPLPLPMFGLLVACAVAAAAACLRAELVRMGQHKRIGNAKRALKETGEWLDVPAQEIVPDLAVAVLLAGIVGARLFHILEHWDSFVAAPWPMIFSRSGLSVFGGLIFGAITGLVLVKRWKLAARPFFDAIAPALMLGYAIGRIGCQIAGDGDWGSASNMSLKPEWIPTWLWAQTYENNIYGAVIAAPGVYPTPVYETLMAAACFALLWALRKHRFKPGWLGAVYLVLAGLERLAIEQIRVNPAFDVGGVRATQAEMIAIGLTVAGLVGLAVLTRRQDGMAPDRPVAPRA